MSETVNIKKLAQELNISIATVSKALNDSYEISTKTKNRVWELAKALNYTPNASASNLRSHKSKTIAVIIPSVTNNFFALAIKGIEEVARQFNYHVLIYQTHEDMDKEIAFTNSLLNGRVDGILTSVSSNNNNSDYYASLINKIPLVFFDRVFESIDTIKVITNDFEVAFEAAEHMIMGGCKKIAYLCGLKKLQVGVRRFNGFSAALNKHGLIMDNDFIIDFLNDDEADIAQIKKLLIEQKPDGLFSSIEEFVIPVYTACNDLKLEIPKRIKLLSFSNLSTAKFLKPSLTTVTQPAFEMGVIATKSLFNLLNKKCYDKQQTIILDSSLLKRATTGY